VRFPELLATYISARRATPGAPVVPDVHRTTPGLITVPLLFNGKQNAA